MGNAAIILQCDWIVAWVERLAMWSFAAAPIALCDYISAVSPGLGAFVQRPLAYAKRTARTWEKCPPLLGLSCCVKPKWLSKDPADAVSSPPSGALILCEPDRNRAVNSDADLI